MIMIAIGTSCSKKNAEDLTPVIVNDTLVEDTIVTCAQEGLYASEVKPIFDNNCVQCHQNNAVASNLPMSTYNETSSMSSERLLGSIKHESGFLEMPRNESKLSDCDIETIQKWVDAGRQNN